MNFKFHVSFLLLAQCPSVLHDYVVVVPISMYGGFAFSLTLYSFTSFIFSFHKVDNVYEVVEFS